MPKPVPRVGERRHRVGPLAEGPRGVLRGPGEAPQVPERPEEPAGCLTGLDGPVRRPRRPIPEQHVRDAVAEPAHDRPGPPQTLPAPLSRLGAAFEATGGHPYGAVRSRCDGTWRWVRRRAGVAAGLSTTAVRCWRGSRRARPVANLHQSTVVSGHARRLARRRPLTAARLLPRRRGRRRCTACSCERSGRGST